jgi:hypothetical protein
MTLPDVSVKFSNGNLGISPGGNIDGVFAAIGPCSVAPVNQVLTVVDPSTVPAILGYGPLAELVMQMLAASGNPVQCIAATQQPGGVGPVSSTRVGGPQLFADSLLGIPGAFLAASSSNTGNGSVQFDSQSVPTARHIAETISVSVTSAAPAMGDISINGSVVASGQPLVGTWTDSSTGIKLDFIVPLGGGFQASDVFTANATPTDAHKLLLSITSINAGFLQFSYSLDGGITVVGPFTAPLPPASPLPVTVTAAGLTPPTLAVSGTGSQAANITVTCTQGGTAIGLNAQCPNGSSMAHSGSGPGVAVGSVTQPIGTMPGAAGTVTATLTIAAAGTATGTGTGNGTSYDPPGGGGSGSGAGGTLVLDDAVHGSRTYTFVQGTNELVATFTETSTGIVFNFDSSPGAFGVGDVYTIVINPPAIFQYKVGTVTASSSFYLGTGGVPADHTGAPLSPAISGTGIPSIQGPDLVFAHSNIDVYTHDSMTPSNTNVYTFAITTPFTYMPRERDGSPVGLILYFGPGVYQVGDQYSCVCTPPSVLSGDADTALNRALTASGVDFSVVHFACEPATFSDAAEIAAVAQTDLHALEASPTYRFISAVVFGPSIASSVSGATWTDFVTATHTSAFDRVGMTCGTVQLTSVLTGRQLERNAGYPIGARLTTDSVEQDPGAVSDGPLENVVIDLTPLADATQFDANRGMTVRMFAGLVGTYCNQGLTLAAPGSDYGLFPRRRVIDKAARYGRLALLPLVNTKVRTVPGTGTILPADASSINAGTRGQILANCAGNFQDVTVVASLTANVLSTNTLPVTISVLPFGYAKFIPVTIGFTTG